MKSRSVKLLILNLAIIFVGASCQSVIDGGVFRSGDQAETWEQKVYVGRQKKKVISIADISITKFEFDPIDPNIIYLMTKSGLFKTESAGEQWRKLNLPTTIIRDIAIDYVNPNVLYVAVNNNIFKSIDAGANWEIIYTDSQNALLMQIEADWYTTSRVYASTNIGTVLLSEDGGVNWSVIYEIDEPIVRIIMDANDSRTVYLLELDKNVHKTTDSGLTWNLLFTKENRDDLGNLTKLKDLFTDPNNSSILYGRSNQGIIRTYNGGQSWEYLETLIDRGVAANKSISSVSVLPENSSIIIFAAGRILHKTTDNGLTWKTIENFPSKRKITTLAIQPKNPDVLFAGTEQVEKKKGGFFSIKK